MVTENDRRLIADWFDLELDHIEAEARDTVVLMGPFCIPTIFNQLRDLVDRFRENDYRVD